MDPIPEKPWWRRLLSGGPDTRRALLLLLSGVLAVQVGFVWVGTHEAEQLIIHGGYYYILGVFAAFVALSLKLLGERRAVWLGWLRRPGWPGLVIALATVFVLMGDPFGHKILFDEYVLQSTARYMHETRQIETVYRSYWLDGTFLPIDAFLDKRPYFFAFLVCLVHDLTGYRVANLFLVNAACVPVFLGLTYYFASSLAGRRAGILAVLLLATLPLLAQNATGAGMEMHNLTMIALTLCLALLYLRKPDALRLALLCLSTVLLSQSRYESVIFVGPVAFVIWSGWARRREPLITGTLIATPLLFIPYAWHNRVLSATPLLWQLQEGQTARFSTAYLDENLRGAWHFFFDVHGDLADSWWLSALGLAALLYVLWLGLRRSRRRETAPLTPASYALVAFGLGAAVHLTLLQFYYWARFDDVIASRFSLPTYFVAALCAALMAGRLEQRWKGVMRAAFWGTGLYLFAGAIPAMATHLYTSQNTVAAELRWELSFVQARPKVPRLIIADKSTMPWIIHDIPAIIATVAAQRGNQIRYHMQQQTFQEVLVTQSIRPTSPNGDFGVNPADRLPPQFHLRTLAEKRFGGRLERISLVESVDYKAPPPGKADAKSSGNAATPKD